MFCVVYSSNRGENALTSTEGILNGQRIPVTVLSRSTPTSLPLLLGPNLSTMFVLDLPPQMFTHLSNVSSVLVTEDGKALLVSLRSNK